MTIKESFPEFFHQIDMYAIVDNGEFSFLYNRVLNSHVLLEITPEERVELFKALINENIVVVKSVEDIRDTNLQQYVLKWDAEKKEYIKVLRKYQ